MSGEIHGRPTVAELLDATIVFLRDQVPEHLDARFRHQSRLAVRALEIVAREVEMRDEHDQAHQARLHALGYQTDGTLAAAIRCGELDDSPLLRRLLADDTRDRLLVANPRWLSPDS